MRLESVTATTDARSLYRVLASDTARTESDSAQVESDTVPTESQMTEADTLEGEEARPPALHYVKGNQITIHLEGRKVARMEVQGQTVGYHLEPLPPDTLPAAEDSAAAVLDTVDAAADTADAGRDTIVAAVDTTRTPPDTTSTPMAARPGTPRRSGIGSIRHGFQSPINRRRPGARA